MKRISAKVSDSRAITLLAVASGLFAGVVGFFLAFFLTLETCVSFLPESYWRFVLAGPLALLFGSAFGLLFYRGWHSSGAVYTHDVYDCRDHIVVENNEERREIRFDEITSVTYSALPPLRIVIATDTNANRPPIVFLPMNALETRALVRSLRDRIS